MSTIARKSPPKLHPGDRLSARQFMRRYEAMPDLKKAELIKGVVYMPSPVSLVHSTPHGIIMGWLTQYWAQTPGVQPEDNATLLLDVGENRPQPDALLRILPEHGGQSRTRGEYVAGAPELVVEIAASSVSIDLHDKLEAYEENGVLEYVVWRVEDEEIDWFALQKKYKRQRLNRKGYYESRVFPGLWLDPQAAIRKDIAEVLRVVQLGLASGEHKKFALELARRKGH